MMNLAIFNRKAARVAAAALVASTALYWGQNMVSPGQFGMRVSFWKADPKIQESGWKAFVPFVQYVHSYNQNTQRIEFNAGSCRFLPWCDSTADHNPLLAHVGINYKVRPDIPKLALQRWAMDGWIMPDGYWLISELANESANAVLGQQSMAQALQKPEQFLKDFQHDLAQRLERSNVPVDLQSIELLGLKTRFPTTMPFNGLQLGPG
jgi:regulator of protease activity HflC (stomatin/prohibitin superfamily)